ncbi:hypothetical protein FHS16_002802 [Paenibacillus endophyticus]|uniref:Uncharacterized protein n=1 Tax=Paenibacillus endophyticus TaxID=1294268 RepID=A0A7W5C8L8_9BACL|nr:hypothetical protein [Paenibacillus endophyticus]
MWWIGSNWLLVDMTRMDGTAASAHLAIVEE